MIFCFLFDTIVINFKGSNVKHFNIIPKNPDVTYNYSGKNSSDSPSVLITGGNGLVGRNLQDVLLSEGFHVSVLSRNSGHTGKVKVFSWNPEKKIIDPGILTGIDYIIHLAGANLGLKRWTKKRKEEIIASRILPARFLHKIVADNKIDLKAFITASATGYYGCITSDKIFSEEDPASEDFLGTTCRLWEEGADLFTDMGIRTVKIRSAVVLDKKGGPLGKLMRPAEFGLVVRLSNGKQFIPWIHVNDLCNIYLKAVMDQDMHGAYNVAAPEHINHNDFVGTMARVMGKSQFLPSVPSWALRAVLGEMSDIVLKGSRISSEKIIKAGYTFRFDNLEAALTDIIGSERG
jgi:uncharacterized protein (TIGR01777 family)